jgi:multidrug efflux pump subunit AcrB
MRRWIALGIVALIVVAIGAAVLWLGADPPPRERIRVSIALPGADAVSVDEQLGAMLASTFAELDPNVRTFSRDGVADAIIELPEGRAIDTVRDRVRALTPSLPSQSEHPVILRVPRGPVVRWMVRGEHASARQWTIEARVSRIEGASRVESCVRGEEIEVLVDPARLLGRDLDAGDVADALASSSDRQAGGYIAEDDGLLVRTVGSPSMDDLGETLIAAVDGVFLRVSDVARVRRSLSRAGCRCVSDTECATGAVFLRDEAGVRRVEEILREEQAERVRGRALVAVATFDDTLVDYASSIARRTGAVVELAPHTEPGGRHADLAVLSTTADEVAVVDEPGSRPLPERPLVIDVVGDDVARLGRARVAVEAALHGAGFDASAEIRWRPRVLLDRARMNEHGVSPEDAQRALRLATEGELVLHMREGQTETPVRVRVGGPVEEVRVRARAGAIPLREVMASSMELAAARVMRCGGRPCVRIYADGSDRDRAREAVLEVEIPPGVTIAWGADD